MTGVEGKIKGGVDTPGLSPVCTSVFSVDMVDRGVDTDLRFSQVVLGETVSTPKTKPFLASSILFPT
ncbi:hypothetical protein GCM10007853_17350 [Algimonas ampicilliniresistens]|uniref:Uncharacterized protein n=1 Tax=Algimonas ampicilliniresistens TaxID=1298735 RepID=A0ABQ5V8J0_9PROT|nr:hypothetical protein GCM10007853_17350 [Algimonas ampicilliniresistens]